MAEELTPERLNDQIRQQHHADIIKERRAEQRAERANPEGAKAFAKLMQFARDSLPQWHGSETAAQKNSYAVPANVPKSVPPPKADNPLPVKNKHISRSGVEGGSITFIAPMADNTFASITADATSSDAPDGFLIIPWANWKENDDDSYNVVFGVGTESFVPTNPAAIEQFEMQSGTTDYGISIISGATVSDKIKIFNLDGNVVIDPTNGQLNLKLNLDGVFDTATFSPRELVMRSVAGLGPLVSTLSLSSLDFDDPTGNNHSTFTKNSLSLQYDIGGDGFFATQGELSILNGGNTIDLISSRLLLAASTGQTIIFDASIVDVGKNVAPVAVTIGGVNYKFYGYAT